MFDIRQRLPLRCCEDASSVQCDWDVQRVCITSLWTACQFLVSVQIRKWFYFPRPSPHQPPSSISFFLNHGFITCKHICFNLCLTTPQRLTVGASWYKIIAALQNILFIYALIYLLIWKPFDLNNHQRNHRQTHQPNPDDDVSYQWLLLPNTGQTENHCLKQTNYWTTIGIQWKVNFCFSRIDISSLHNTTSQHTCFQKVSKKWTRIMWTYPTQNHCWRQLTSISVTNAASAAFRLSCESSY